MRKTFRFIGSLAYLVIIIFLLNAFLVAAETQQVRVIDKIIVKPVTNTEEFKEVRGPSVSGSYVTWMDKTDIESNQDIPIVYLKNLKTGEVRKVSDDKSINPTLVHDNYVFGFPSTEIYDIRNNEFFKTNLICKFYDYSDGKLFFFCSDGIKIYDLKKREIVKIIADILDYYGTATWYGIKSVEYPYILLSTGIYNIETGELKKVKISNAMLDRKYLITHLGGPTGDALIDIESFSIIQPNVIPEAGYTFFKNNLFVGHEKGNVKLYDLAMQKKYTIEAQYIPDSDHDMQFDGNAIVWIDNRNKNKFPLYGNTNTDIYMAQISFKYVTVDVNETKLPLTEELKENPIIIVEGREGLSLPLPKTEISGCSEGSQCETGVCNLKTGYCVECYGGICNCQEGYKACLGNSKCVKLNSKKAGDYYDCEFECQSGLGKGGQCIDPITISLSTTKKTVGVGDGTDITISFDNALNYTVETDLTITSGDGVSVSSSEACQTGSRNLCKSFHKIGAKEVKQLSIRVDCIDAVKKIPIGGKITYTAGSLSTTIEKTLEIDCIKASIMQNSGFFDKLFRFLKSVFS